MKNKEIIINFLKQMAEQNNCGTAAPYFHVIKSKTTVPAPVDNCDEIRYYLPEEYDLTYKSIQEMERDLKENGYTAQEIKSCVQVVEEFGIRYEWKEHGMFLTREDAENHLKTNHYHYSADAYVYVKAAWRAPKLKEFFQALFKEYGVYPTNWDD